MISEVNNLNFKSVELKLDKNINTEEAFNEASIFNAAHSFYDEKKGKEINVIDYREENEILDKINIFFKRLTKQPVYEIHQEGNDTIIKNKDGFSSTTTYVYTNNPVNGKLDNEIHQGHMEDCALISLCYSLSLDEVGENILKDAISINYNQENEVESYSVFFKGLDETYTISKEEFDEARESNIKQFLNLEEYSYSWGDNDMLLLELAWTKCCLESEKLAEFKTNHNTIVTTPQMPKGLSGTNPVKLFYALTGDELKSPDGEIYQFIKRRGSQFKEENIKNYLKNNNEFTLDDLIGGKATKAGFTCYNSDKKTIKCECSAQDEYELLIHPDDSEDNTITYKNKNTNETYCINYREFINYIAGILTDNEKLGVAQDSYKATIGHDVAVLGTNENMICKDINNEKICLVGQHLYSVKSISDEEITLLNPWDTSVEIVLPKEELLKYPTGFRFQFGDIIK